MTERYALIIGNSIYDDLDNFKPIPYALNDSNDIFSLLTNSSTSIFSEKTSILANNIKNKKDLEEIVNAFFANIAQSSMVLFYFAGHAEHIGGKRLFLIMQNSEKRNLSGTAFNIEWLIPYFEERRIERYVVILDCCRAGAALNSPGVRFRGILEETNLNIPSEQGKIFVASARWYESANELKELEHGLFSHYFIQGIKTGEAVKPSDEFIDISNLCIYIQKQIEKNHSSILCPQTPVMSGVDVIGELKIAKNLKFNPIKNLRYEQLEQKAQSKAFKRLKAVVNTLVPWKKGRERDELELNEKEAKCFLTNLYLLEKTPNHLLFQANQLDIIATRKSPRTFIFRLNLLNIEEFTSLYQRVNLEPGEFTHRKRVQLILSFAEAVYEWSMSGVMLEDFRAEEESFKDLYLYRKIDNDQQFILGDLKAFSDKGALNFERTKIKKSVLSKALRFLYYGRSQKSDIKETLIYKEPWNDNVVSEVADYLDKNSIEIRDFKAVLEELFADEVNGIPLIFSYVAPQFIDDMVKTRIKSIGETFYQAQLTHIINDHGLWEEDVFYVLWDEAQIGLLEETDNDIVPFTLFRPTLIVSVEIGKSPALRWLSAYSQANTHDR